MTHPVPYGPEPAFGKERRYYVDPLSIITMGFVNGHDHIPSPAIFPLTILSMGYIVYLDIEVVPPPQLSGPGGGIRDGRKLSDLDDLDDLVDFYKKKITVCVLYKGEKYCDSLLVDDLTITVDDVTIQVDKDDLNESIKVKIVLKKDLMND